MSSDGFFDDDAHRERRSDARQGTMRKRVAAQHILRNYSPLLVRPIRAGETVSSALSSEAFREDIALSRTIASRVFGAVHGRDPATVNPAESRAIRADVVTLVASLREHGLHVDPDAIVESVTGAFDVADGEFDAETMRWADMSDKGSAALTATHATMGLMQATGIYDFRLGGNVALGRCVDVVIRVASEGVHTILGDGVTHEDRKSLKQSLLRDMARLLSARYEATARQTVKTVMRLPPDRHSEYFARERPFETLLERFRVDAGAYVNHVAKATLAQVEAEAKLDPERGYL